MGSLPQPREFLPLEAYLPPDRAPDWSAAGYRGGQEAFPSPDKVHDPAEFGAKGDGITDDTAALQFALAAANAEPGVVELGEGTYRLALPLKITSSGVVLRGQGVSEPGGLPKLSPRPADRLASCRRPPLPPLLARPWLLTHPPQADKTRILVTAALADVFPGTWSQDAVGTVTTQWASQGGFIQIM